MTLQRYTNTFLHSNKLVTSALKQYYHDAEKTQKTSLSTFRLTIVDEQSSSHTQTR